MTNWSAVAPMEMTAPMRRIQPPILTVREDITVPFWENLLHGLSQSFIHEPLLYCSRERRFGAVFLQHWLLGIRNGRELAQTSAASPLIANPDRLAALALSRIF